MEDRRTVGAISCNSGDGTDRRGQSLMFIIIIIIIINKKVGNTDIRRLTSGICSQKCVVRRFRRCANVIECTYTNLDSTV